MKPKLLILDDDTAILQMLKAVFSGDDLELILESDSDSALKRVITEHPNAAIFDIGLPVKSGIEVLREAKKMDPALSVIVATGNKTTQNAIEAMRHGAYDYVTKPFDLKKLKTLVSKAVECNLLNRKVRFTKDREQLTEYSAEEDIMIGSSPEMIEIWKMVGKVADSDATILIQGESGTGKELLARAIYDNSRRRNRPFLAVNCAAMPESLLESELFGHEKGAFTDAHSRRIGKFEQCNGGTIFLDEIGEMSMANQGKLLRVLENQEFERVGGNETIKVDVRVIAATNRTLVNSIKEKTFRMDLFYRLRVVSFYLPPLRERVEDIPLMVDLFIRKFSTKYGKKIKGIAPDALDMLIAHPWEGNIRELKNVINSATVFCKGDILMPDDFESFLQAKAGFKEVDLDSAGEDYYAVFWNMLEPVFDGICMKNKGAIYEHINMGLEKALIHMAMEKSNNNQVLAAKLLGISRNTLRDRLERYKIGASA
ncbi:sigma-54 dependent transcriptional regulator [Geobacter sp. DSM 9736]|uniref:sigma-54-dependent transcriptional regulator n=1 Tax=Geobacter sp. DSM 9736 TaxID=1277350 RepID=UPI000B508063|nr:sigma-54 dependent transcriptional regulator [Geobacter sp. DSM 9736]SNB45309.1 DNA-binding transcriptional response regulator, NtrC family, contains REC, AAA-type ATPase, and a Fis-type DNA-binding domains [Geobacter sp. DSM 9736]